MIIFESLLTTFEVCVWPECEPLDRRMKPLLPPQKTLRRLVCVVACVNTHICHLDQIQRKRAKDLWRLLLTTLAEEEVEDTSLKIERK